MMYVFIDKISVESDKGQLPGIYLLSRNNNENRIHADSQDIPVYCICTNTDDL
jgi:hypothetical protein